MNTQLNNTKLKLATGVSALILGTAMMASSPAQAQDACRSGTDVETLECGDDASLVIAVQQQLETSQKRAVLSRLQLVRLLWRMGTFRPRSAKSSPTSPTRYLPVARGAGSPSSIRWWPLSHSPQPLH